MPLPVEPKRFKKYIAIAVMGNPHSKIATVAKLTALSVASNGLRLNASNGLRLNPCENCFGEKKKENVKLDDKTRAPDALILAKTVLARQKLAKTVLARQKLAKTVLARQKKKTSN